MAVVIIVVLGVLFFLFRLTRAIRRAVVPPPVPEVVVAELSVAELARLGLPEGAPPEQAIAALEEIRRREEEGIELPPEGALPEEEDDLNRILAERERTRGRLMTIARDRPDEVVRLLETWLAQD